MINHKLFLEELLAAVERNISEGRLRAHQFVTENAGAIAYVYASNGIPYIAVRGEEIVDSDKDRYNLIAKTPPNLSLLPTIYTFIGESVDWMQEKGGSTA